ncbi:MAG: methyltransferase domain-containing protein [Candidatus Melainabacteria bacterium]|nr:methyltransferase domain-containing protein [Candidatus Melainabacteria bacterium]
MDQYEKERSEVERAAKHYYHTALQLGIDNRTKKFVIERCRPFLKGPKVLELGYVDGSWSELIVGSGYLLDIVEGASKHVGHATNKFSNVSAVHIFHELFQEFTPTDPYDTVIAADMLRYLADASGFLRKVRNWLSDDGVLIATVPNSRSLHRRIGALMNLESTPTGANIRDIEVGNQRSYDRYEFRSLLLNAGYTINELRGCFLKPLSSAQMESWSDEMLEAFLQIGNELEDYCWFLYAVCQKT